MTNTPTSCFVSPRYTKMQTSPVAAIALKDFARLCDVSDLDNISIQTKPLVKGKAVSSPTFEMPFVLKAKLMVQL